MPLTHMVSNRYASEVPIAKIVPIFKSDENVCLHITINCYHKMLVNSTLEKFVQIQIN